MWLLHSALSKVNPSSKISLTFEPIMQGLECLFYDWCIIIGRLGRVLIMGKKCLLQAKTPLLYIPVRKKANKDLFFFKTYFYEGSENLKKKTIMSGKIPHTGDTKSFDRWYILPEFVTTVTSLTQNFFSSKFTFLMSFIV